MCYVYTLNQCSRVKDRCKFHDISKIAARHGTGWLQAHSDSPFVLQNVCLHACATWNLQCKLTNLRNNMYLAQGIRLKNIYPLRIWCWINCWSSDKLWVALRVHGVYNHLVWTMQKFCTPLEQIQSDADQIQKRIGCWRQTVVDSLRLAGDSRVFPGKAGVGHTLGLFATTLSCIMQKCRQRVANELGGTVDKGRGAVKLERLYWKICPKMFNSKAAVTKCSSARVPPGNHVVLLAGGLAVGFLPRRRPS